MCVLKSENRFFRQMMIFNFSLNFLSPIYDQPFLNKAVFPLTSITSILASTSSSTSFTSAMSTSTSTSTSTSKSESTSSISINGSCQFCLFNLFLLDHFLTVLTDRWLVIPAQFWGTFPRKGQVKARMILGFGKPLSQKEIENESVTKSGITNDLSALYVFLIQNKKKLTAGRNGST